MQLIVNILLAIAIIYESRALKNHALSDEHRFKSIEYQLAGQKPREHSDYDGNDGHDK